MILGYKPQIESNSYQAIRPTGGNLLYGLRQSNLIVLNTIVADLSAQVTVDRKKVPFAAG
jgi:hypothetical protein